MSTRKSISKKLRFEVFKRDKFQCQYCGAKAPDVVLECDHIEPVSKGGGDDILNLITSCKDCNSGKSDRKLTDSTVLDRQREQLAELEERRQQLEAMLKWREELSQFHDQVADRVIGYWNSKIDPYSVNEHGIEQFHKWLSRFKPEELIEAIDASLETYVCGEYAEDRIIKAFWMIPRVASNKRRFGGMDEDRKCVFYCRGILRNRLRYMQESRVLEMLSAGLEAGLSHEELKDLCKSVRNWSEFRLEIESLIANGEQ